MTTPSTLSRHDFAIGTVIALVMTAVFVWLSPGRALLVTFVPGVAASWALFAFLFLRRQKLPEFSHFVPWYLLTLAVQFLHFAEEFVTGFQNRFGVIYGGGQIDNATFVIVNMTSYFVFLVSPLAAWYLGKRFLLLPMLFFIVYGAIANAITHSFWSLVAGDYFPGLVTAQLYWVLGPLALVKLGLSRAQTAGFVALWAVVLLALVGGFLDLGALRAG